jgi:DnaJ-class molecular chaperone
MNIKSSLEELEIYKDNLLTLDKNYIKKKYHQLALKWHPDKNNHPYAKTKFQKINESYDFLIFELDTNSNTFTNTNSCTNTFNTNSNTFNSNNSYINILTDFFNNISKSNNNHKNNNNVDDYDIFLLIKDIIIKSDTISKLKEKFKLLNQAREFLILE